MWVTHALFNGESTVDITYQKWLNGVGYHDHTIFLDTVPQGNWTELSFDSDCDTTVISFLNSMVYKNLEVQRKIAQLCLEHVTQKYEYYNNAKMIQLMDNICILDPTFTPPIFNEICGWQMDLLSTIVSNSGYRVISTCRNMRRLDRYSKTLQLM